MGNYTVIVAGMQYKSGPGCYWRGLVQAVKYCWIGAAPSRVAADEMMLSLLTLLSRFRVETWAPRDPTKLPATPAVTSLPE